METCAAQVAWVRVEMNDNEFIQIHREAGTVPSSGGACSREIPKEWETCLRLSAAKPARCEGTAGQELPARPLLAG